jgi:hypothetical protein
LRTIEREHLYTELPLARRRRASKNVIGALVHPVVSRFALDHRLPSATPPAWNEIRNP